LQSGLNLMWQRQYLVALLCFAGFHSNAIACVACVVCVRCVNENRKKRKRMRWQAANHGCHCFGRAFLLAGACVCWSEIFTQQTQIPANRNARSKQWQSWLTACQRKRLRFLRFSFTQRTQRKRLRLNGNRALDYSLPDSVFQLMVVALVMRRKTTTAMWHVRASCAMCSCSCIVYNNQCKLIGTQYCSHGYKRRWSSQQQSMWAAGNGRNFLSPLCNPAHRSAATHKTSLSRSTVFFHACSRSFTFGPAPLFYGTLCICYSATAGNRF